MRCNQRFISAFSVVLFAVAAAERPQTYEELAAASDRIVVGTVGVKASHWGDDSRIYTEVLIYPDVTIKGQEESAVVAEIPGGTVGDTTMTESDGPEFQDGERVVAFLKQEAGRFVVVGRMAGTVRAASPQARIAVESGFTSVERAAGVRLQYKRGLAAAALGSRATPSAAVQVGCYSTDGAKWSTSSAAYRIGTTIPSGWAPSLDAAAATWSNAGVAFKLVNDSTTVDELSFKDLVATYGSSYPNTLAVTTTWSSHSTGRISKATTEFNSKYTWSTSGESNSIDVQNIATHELGHWTRLQPPTTSISAPNLRRDL